MTEDQDGGGLMAGGDAQLGLQRGVGADGVCGQLAAAEAEGLCHEVHALCSRARRKALVSRCGDDDDLTQIVGVAQLCAQLRILDNDKAARGRAAVGGVERGLQNQVKISVGNGLVGKAGGGEGVENLVCGLSGRIRAGDDVVVAVDPVCFTGGNVGGSGRSARLGGIGRLRAAGAEQQQGKRERQNTGGG